MSSSTDLRRLAQAARRTIAQLLEDPDRREDRRFAPLDEEIVAMVRRLSETTWAYSGAVGAVEVRGRAAEQDILDAFGHDVRPRLRRLVKRGRLVRSGLPLGALDAPPTTYAVAAHGDALSRPSTGRAGT
jgi:hypothetical protein